MYITDCIFDENRSNGAGGGLYIGNGLEMEVSNCHFSNNSARDGGGIGVGGGAGGARIINCLIVDNLCDDDGGGLYSTVGVSISLCTVAGNTAVARGGGVHVTQTGSITDCIIYNNTAGVEGHSILVPSGTVNCNYSCIQFGYSGFGNISTDPMWEPSHPYYLQPGSPCVDSGSGPASNICYSSLGGGYICMSDLTTQLDSTPDTGVVDMGFHYPITTAASTVSAAYSCTPDSGFAPFNTAMVVELTNNYTGYLRRVAGRIDARLANTSVITNWRKGYTNLGAGASFTSSWNQSIPAISALIGENVFTLTAVDVTPAPYNQPPYPPAGDWDSDSCTVTAQ